jgi:hypothetical protein
MQNLIVNESGVSNEFKEPIEEFIVLDELLGCSEIIKENGLDGLDSLDALDGLDKLDDLELGFQKMYQIRAEKGGKGAVIQFVGKAKSRPCVVIHEFVFKRYKCQLVSYVLSDVDVKYANDKCELKMLGLLISSKKNKLVASITLSFYTFEHRKEKRDLGGYINYEEPGNKLSADKLLNGFWMYEMKYVDQDVKDNIKKERIGNILVEYPGKNACVYSLINLLSNKTVVQILNL